MPFELSLKPYPLPAGEEVAFILIVTGDDVVPGHRYQIVPEHNAPITIDEPTAEILASDTSAGVELTFRSEKGFQETGRFDILVHNLMDPGKNIGAWTVEVLAPEVAPDQKDPSDADDQAQRTDQGQGQDAHPQGTSGANATEAKPQRHFPFLTTLVVFVLVVLVGIFLAMVFWPEEESTSGNTQETPASDEKAITKAEEAGVKADKAMEQAGEAIKAAEAANDTADEAFNIVREALGQLRVRPTPTAPPAPSSASSGAGWAHEWESPCRPASEEEACD